MNEQLEIFVTISLAELYEKTNGHLEHGCIEKDSCDGTDYYNLYASGSLACMDGEEVEVIGSDHGCMLLCNYYGDIPVRFKLTPYEYMLAAM